MKERDMQAATHREKELRIIQGKKCQNAVLYLQIFMRGYYVNTNV